MAERSSSDRALGPVVLPAHDEIAAAGIMAVIAEVPATELELDPHTLPYVPADRPLGLAVRKSSPYALHDEAEIECHHAEQEDHALLVDVCAC
jgi:hypothetical protein